MQPGGGATTSGCGIESLGSLAPTGALPPPRDSDLMVELTHTVLEQTDSEFGACCCDVGLRSEPPGSTM